MSAPLALYRRYRPETFAEVVAQEHVTDPLRAALANNRVNHAYLFSGPRGCGKTTSARILARALNCAANTYETPRSEPCGECDSCRELARGGGGSIDVIEIDAASHGGVDDARDLREKAFFAPVRDRFKIYIIDEAHMVSPAGFNALLKLVEEPPEHLRFIFATTAPDKVLGTIRSRTHHYPFRLIPPRTMADYLAELCERESVSIDPAALPLVVRAGAGSARDTLSVLDQLIGGAGPEGVTYQLASGLLGFTPDTLLDDVIDAFAATDGQGVFAAVDRAIETGLDPRRFAEDLLQRLRDLIILSAVPDAAANGMLDVPEDRGERMTGQAARFGKAELTRAAGLVSSGLTELKGATAPRVLLELICARVLVPGADHSTQGVHARLDRLERRQSITPVTATQETASAATPPAPSPPTPSPPAPEPPPTRAEPEPRPQAPTQSAPPPPAAAPAGSVLSSTPPEPEEPEEPPAAPAASSDAEAPAERSAGQGPMSLTDVRRLWPDLIERTKTRRRMTWIHLSQNAQVVGVDDKTLTLGFTNAGARDSFESGGSNEIVRQIAIDVLGVDWRVETIVDPGAQAPGAPESAPARPAPPAPAAAAAAAPTEEPPARRAPEPPADEPPPWARAEDEPAPDPEPMPPQQPSPRDRDTGPAGESPDDDDADELAEETGPALLERELGAQVIEEIPHN